MTPNPSQSKSNPSKSLSPKRIAEILLEEFYNPFSYKNFDRHLAAIAIKKAQRKMLPDAPADICYPSVKELKRRHIIRSEYAGEYCASVSSDVLNIAKTIYRRLYYQKIATQIWKALQLVEKILGENQ